MLIQRESGRDSLALARRLATVDLLVPFAGALAAVAGLAAANGGYFPSAWGWPALAFAWVVALALVIRGGLTRARLELAVITALAALAAWQLFSATWGPTTTWPAFEAERTLLYAAAVAAALLVANRRTAVPLLGAVLGAIVIVDLYALATRLFPGRLGSYDQVAANRLAEPLGYWNGVGIFTVLGALLALGFAIRARSLAARSVASASLTLLLVTLYFTYSRGSWIVLALALLVALAVDPRRAQLATAGAAIAAPAVLAVWLASLPQALGTQGAELGAAADGGRTLALRLIPVVAAAAATGLVVALAERAIDVSPQMRRAHRAALITVGIAVVIALFTSFGGPIEGPRKAWRSFTAPPVKVEPGGRLEQRLFSLSSNGRIDFWRAAWDEASAHRWLGGGAGSFESWWVAHRGAASKVRDAHSLYVEALAELGPVGLALLVVALGAPLVAVRRVRRQPMLPFAVAAYAAFLVHAAADWDWELPAVTVAALFCGCAILTAARTDSLPLLSWRFRTAGLALTAVALAAAVVVAVGNSAMSAASSAAARGDWAKSATEARLGTRWARWSSEPWRLLGEAQLARGESGAARASFRKAIAKDSGNWSLWLDLARASFGTTQRDAFARARQLNPLSPELAQFGREFGL